MRKNWFFISVVMLLIAAFVSCSTHSKILKSTDNEYKYNAAMMYYKQKDYNRALQLFDILQAHIEANLRQKKLLIIRQIVIIT